MHECTADCWAYGLRYGMREGCDAFAARDAADREREDDYALTEHWERAS